MSAECSRCGSHMVIVHVETDEVKFECPVCELNKARVKIQELEDIICENRR